MFYYQTFVNEISYKGTGLLTYSSEIKLEAGTIIIVPLKNKFVLGFIYRATLPPKFTTKHISEVFSLPPLPMHALKLANWMQSYYSSSIGIIAQHFIPKQLSNKHQLMTDNTSAYSNKPSLPSLTPEQKSAIEQVTGPNTYILHGETGSGKTRVYIELALKSLKKNRSVIVLTPEIGLTPQLGRDFQKIFGETNIIITHSQLTEKERRENWKRSLYTSRPLIIIGPRSALFSPLKDIGLIILDESHDSSYKQDQSPHYHASKVAAKLAELHNATLILGSATPSIADYFLAQKKQKPILRMLKIALENDYKPPYIKLVDIKERRHFSRSTHISDELLTKIGKALTNSEQSLLFLNRRGTARVVLCNKCGWQALCPNCNLPLTYHGDIHRLRCHTCGHSEIATNCCPICQNSDIVLKNVGTKAIADEISTIFPQARVQRFDTDNKKSERIENNYEAIQSGEIDILVGTQILVKGLDLPKLSVIGIIIGDASLSFPDYTSQERTYQLLRQVIGRVGRGHRDSSVILQTYDTHNFVINAAIKGQWLDFYKYELAERKKFTFPPYCFLLKLTCRRANSVSAQRTANNFAEKLRQSSIRIIVDGPAPSFYEKIGNKYQWQVVVKAKERNELLKVMALLPSGWTCDIDPVDLL